MNLSGDRKADPTEQNFKKQSAVSQLSQIKDPEVKKCMQGLLEKTTSSIIVNRNPESKLIRKELGEAKIKEAESLRLTLKQALNEQGLTDLPAVFKKFDTDGNGFFSQIELECAFTVLGIQFGKDQLRRLIRLSDKNKDGRISFTEFQRMIDTSA